MQALKHTAAPIRRAATIGLGLRSDLLAQLDLVSLLQERLWDFNFEVCQAATIALSRLGTPAAAIALARLLQSPQTPVPLQIEYRPRPGMDWHPHRPRTAPKRDRHRSSARAPRNHLGIRSPHRS
uniref:HEAT repeat domain-containing protein n=1 Tax=Desertifilum tharense IPPAS B-1220 TaxID=1781255 RepID=A0ACD5GQN0_9CYAN